MLRVKGEQMKLYISIKLFKDIYQVTDMKTIYKDKRVLLKPITSVKILPRQMQIFCVASAKVLEIGDCQGKFRWLAVGDCNENGFKILFDPSSQYLILSLKCLVSFYQLLLAFPVLHTLLIYLLVYLGKFHS